MKYSDQMNQEIGHWCAFLDETIKPVLSFIVPTASDYESLDILDTYKDLDSVKAEITSFITKKIQERAASAGGLFAKPVVLADFHCQDTA